MHIESVEVRSLKSIDQAGPLALARGITILVGRNNSGKTSVLDALSGASAVPHRSLAVAPSPFHVVPQSYVRLVLTGGGEDVARWVSSNGEGFSLPAGDLAGSAAFAALDHLQAAPTVRGLWVNRAFEEAAPPPHFFGVEWPWSWAAHLVLANRGEPRPHFLGSGSVQTHLSRLMVKDYFGRSVVRLNADRIRRGRGPVSEDVRLAPDGANLASAMHALQSRDAAAFREVIARVSRIVPSVQHIQVEVAAGEVVIKIFPVAAEARRSDLGVTLEDCGSGVAQVLAVVFALVTADRQRTFLIDEPSSFLHPSAAVSLVELLRDYSQNQYVLATHSPEMIVAAEPEVLYQVRLRDGRSHVSRVDPRDFAAQRDILLDVGVSLSSMFGADQILWVEGQTEETVFPLLVRQFDDERSMRGLKILHVADTGAFERNDAEHAIRVYNRLASGVGLLPPALGFLFDREGRTKAQCDQIIERATKPVRFLVRKMVENYLLHPEAIAKIMAEDDPDHAEVYAAPAIAAWIDEAYTAQKQRSTKAQAGGAALSDASWLAKVDAPVLLRKLFSKLSETRLSYDKVSHGRRIVSQILVSEPAFLAPLWEELKNATSEMKRGR
jgi:ABC-type molybdenum transport system ATPase subunit/photorepair protein PhrA